MISHKLRVYRNKRSLKCSATMVDHVLHYERDLRESGPYEKIRETLLGSGKKPYRVTAQNLILIE